MSATNGNGFAAVQTQEISPQNKGVRTFRKMEEFEFLCSCGATLMAQGTAVSCVRCHTALVREPEALTRHGNQYDALGMARGMVRKDGVLHVKRSRSL